MNNNQTLKTENPPPRIWSIPIEIRRRLSGRGGHQRAISFENHLVIILHRVPNRSTPRQPGVYFWRAPDGTWSHSEQGAGFAALESLVQDYENSVVALEQSNEETNSTKQWFAILDEIGPIYRAARNLHEALTHGLEASADYQQRSQLQLLCDQSSEVERSAELLQIDVQNSIQYSMARQAELQAGFSRAQSRAAHRLNILAAVFLPMATLSSVFGMNLTSGMENAGPMMFWFLLGLGTATGVAIGMFVMNVKALNPDEW